MIPLCFTWTLASAGPLLRGDVTVPDAARLPKYDLAIRISDQDRRYSATGTITWTNRTGGPLTTLSLVIPANAVPVPTVSVGRLEVERGPAGRFEVGLPSDYALTFGAPLADGEQVVIGFEVTGELRQLAPDVNDLFAQGMAQLDSLRGMGGGGDYGLLALGDGIAVAAGAFPMVVPLVGGAPAQRILRADTPIGDLAWNGPATFTATVTTPKGLRVVTNLADGAPAVNGKDQVVVASGTGPSDLVVVASRDWVVAEQAVGDVVVRSWAREPDRAAGQAVLRTGVQSLRFLQRFGAYPYRELDLVEASLVGGAGGVEFGGLALVAGFLYREASPSSVLGMVPGLAQSPAMRIDEQRAFVVAHEVAHQWSPGLVGADAWNHPIVDEPLAQYLAWRVLADGLPPAEAQALADRQLEMNYALMRLLGAEDGAADRPTSGYGSSLQYAGLVYGKAPGLYLALEGSVGRGKLDPALRSAFAARAWTTIDPAGWLGSLEAGGATGAVALGQRWWDEPHGDQDLALDPTGKGTLEAMLGPALAGQLGQACAMMGMTPASCLRMALGRR